MVTSQWWDRAGASQDAPVSVRPVMPTPSGSTTREIGISGGGDHHHSLEAVPMATTLTSEYSLLAVPFSATTNFTDLALKMALCGRLSTCLALLRPTLGEQIPPHLTDRFIVDVLPDVLPEFTPDVDLLCDYCLALAQVLTGRSLLPETEKTLTGLLCDLVWYFVDGLKAPRWIRTAGGVQPVSEVTV
ncbi:ash family protein [Escherichia coli]|nr:ash family protein [Escherichia coli]EEV7019298.1 ash family protein [Escherichia coli]EEX9448871.1 ash family protein [Escherichia coli]EEZ5349867.1 ash family protein [Escherichia coli]EFJ1177253.1 ash family protein [Escherichia coli]